MSTPYDSAAASIPVTIVTPGAALPSVDAGTEVVTLAPAPHAHPPGQDCIACASQSDIRAILFDLLQVSRLRQRRVTSVIVDATALADVAPVIARLERGRVPAMGLRDHTVARSFHLQSVM